ncbi:MAG: T9SS type A sorting domain-containing protein, partial [Ignavibacteriota bacterium]
AVVSHPRDYLSGTLATTRNVIYTGRVNGYGILRSTDKGRTWNDIGGPSVAGDSHSIAVADDYTVFALDEEGSVWRTTNSGGDSLKDFPIVSLATENVSADTIGENILQVPIKLLNLGEARDVDCIVHFDPQQNLKYLGSFSLSNQLLDISGEQWPGRSKLHIPNASSDSVSGYARFVLRADSSLAPTIWFDSLEVFNPFTSCAIYDRFVGSANRAQCFISLPSGCGTIMVSDFLRRGNVKISITSLRPNPAQDEIEIDVQSSLKQDARIEIFDALGASVFSGMQNIIEGKNQIHLDTKDLSGGMYVVRIGDASQSFVKVK